jgi:hypothetical protein
MNRETWERQFTRLLQQELGLEPESIRFHWRQYFNQKYSPEGAIASLRETHRLYPQLRILPETVTAKS